MCVRVNVGGGRMIPIITNNLCERRLYILELKNLEKGGGEKMIPDITKKCMGELIRYPYTLRLVIPSFFCSFP